MHRLAPCAAVILLITCAASCRQNPEVEVLDPNERADLSGNWVAADSQEVARIMCNSILKAAWIDNFRNANEGEKPFIKVAPITVRTNGDDISTEFFTDKIVEELINSGKARASHERSEAWKAHEELAYQDVNATLESRKARFQEQGVDYILIGTIVSQDDANATTKVRAWNVALKLIDVESGEIVWTKTHPHKKRIRR